MTDSSLALDVFGSDKAVFATDAAGGVHTLKVTTDAPSDGVAIDGFGGAKYVIGTVKAGGVHTLCASTDAPNSAILLDGFGTGALRLGTVLSGGVHVVAVTTDAANAAIAVHGFGAGLVALATVLSGGVHTLAVTDAPDSGFAVAMFGADKAVIASAQSGAVHTLAVSGLAPPYVGPLDYRPGAVGVAGTILFYSSYAGPGIRVRNPDTNVESDIDFTSAGVLDSGQIAAAQGASTTLPVVKLYAQDGSGKDYVQATTGKQPLLTQDGPGGRWCVVFDGVDDDLRVTLDGTPVPYTRYIVFNPISRPDTGIHSVVATGSDGVFAAGADPAFYAGQFLECGPVNFSTGMWAISTDRNLSGQTNLRNGKGTASFSGRTSFTLTANSLGGYESGGLGFLNMGCIGITVYPAADDTTAQNLVIDALAAAAGITV